MSVLLGLSLLIPLSALAVDNAGGLVPCGNNDTANITNTVNSSYTPASQDAVQANTCHISDIFKLIARVTNYLIAFAGVYAIFFIVISAVKLVTAAGNEEQISSGKKGLQNALIGLLVVLVAFAIVNSIFSIFGAQLGLQNNFFVNPFQ